jgi:transcriptional regulator with XRE-family HTH domain
VDDKAERSHFANLVARLAREHGGLKQDFARALGISPTVLSQLIAGVYKEPSVELCMRIALVGRVSLRKVLLAAGRPALAAMYTQLRPFEIVDAIELNTSTEHTADWASLDDDTREAFSVLIKAAVHANRTATITPPATQRRRRRR